MKQNKLIKKLAFGRVTIANLNHLQMADVKGGATTVSAYHTECLNSQCSMDTKCPEEPPDTGFGMCPSDAC